MTGDILTLLYQIIKENVDFHILVQFIIHTSCKNNIYSRVYYYLNIILPPLRLLQKILLYDILAGIPESLKKLSCGQLGEHVAANIYQMINWQYVSNIVLCMV